MRNLLKLEINKAIKNKLFYVSILIGCGITCLSLFYNWQVYKTHIYNCANAPDKNPLMGMCSVYGHWIGGEPFSMGTTIYFFVFPILVAIPYGWSYCEEKKNGYMRSLVVKSGKKAYFFSKYVATFFAGGLAMILPLVFNFLLATMIFPSIKPEVIYDTSYGVFGGSLMSQLYYTLPGLYVVCYLVIDFVFGGLIACISMVAASFIKQKVVTMLVPFFVLLGIHYSRQFVYTSYTAQYKEISPLYFMRPVAAEYSASWSVILLEGLILFFITFLVVMVWEKKHEVF